MRKSTFIPVLLSLALLLLSAKPATAQMCVKQATEASSRAPAALWEMSLQSAASGRACPIEPESGGFWGRAFGSAKCESIYYSPTSTGGEMTFSGYSGVLGEGSADALLLILDEAGNPLMKKIIDNHSDDWGAMWKTQDGGYLICGSSLGGSQGQGIWAVKLNSSFGIQWQKYFLEPTAPIPGPGGSILLSSAIFNIGTMSLTLRASKTDTALNAAWRKDYSGPGSYRGSVIPISDGRLFAVGAWSASITDQTADAFIIGIDPATGAILWQTKLGGPGIEAVGNILPAPGGGIYAALVSGGSFGGVPYIKANTPWIVRFSASGQLLWQRYIFGPGEEKLANIEPSGDGGLVISCDTTSSGAGGKDLLLVKFDENGNVLWQKTYGGPGDEKGQVRAEPDGGFLLTGQTTSFGNGGQDAWLVKLDSQGEVIWQRTYGGPAEDYGIAWRRDDGTIILGGGTKSSGAGDADAWAWKLDSEGKVGPACAFIRDSAMISKPGTLTVLTTTASAQSPGVSATTAPAPATQNASLTFTDATLSKGDICVFNCALDCAATAPANSQKGVPVQFQGSAVATGCASNPTFKWDFGDGTTSADQNATHAYPAEGTFTWTFTAEVDGLTCTKSGTIAVSAPPCTMVCDATASPPSGLKPLAVDFTATVQTSDCPDPVTCSWDFGDGGSSTELNPAHTYTSEGEFHWKFTAASGAVTCAAEGTVTVGGTSGKLEGSVAVLSGGIRYILDGPGISGGAVKATNKETGDTATAPLDAGRFVFDDLPFGGYSLVASFDYLDSIPFDAQLIEMGCPKPEGGTISKSITSKETAVQFGAPGQVEINFPRPLVLLHGFLNCYSKWYFEAADAWDTAARSAGFLSFTPNYEWWGDDTSWPQRAGQVAGQIATDMQGLKAGASGTEVPVPYDLVAHDMGGLVARSMLFGDAGGSLGQMAGDIFMMGAPNSGTPWDPGAAYGSSMGVSSVVRRFNETYPDLGGSTGSVYCLGGDTGSGGDGKVTLDSAFNINRVQCTPGPTGAPQCTTFTHIAFESGGRVFAYQHDDLGGPPSKREILDDVILKGQNLASGAGQWSANRQGDPDSPAGALVWGTNSRTIGTASGTVKGARSAGEPGQANFPFTVSPTDMVLVKAIVTAGSATFELFDPDGARADVPRNCFGASPECAGSLFDFSAPNPKEGEWTLKVNPGAEGAEFYASMAENGVFGASCYVVGSPCAPSEKVGLMLVMEGTLAGVSCGDVTATIYRGSEKIAEVPLYDDGQHGDGAAGDGRYGGELDAPPIPGSYSAVFSARGTYSEKHYSRVVFDLLDVLQPSHAFTGVFNDSPADPLGQDRFRALEFRAGVSTASPGKYLVSAQLFDSDGNFIGRAASNFVAGMAGNHEVAIKFDMRALHCAQFEKPFEVRELKLLDASDLSAVDLWPEVVQTAKYSGETFNCSQGQVQPLIRAVRPDQAQKGSTLNILVSGQNFKPEAAISSVAGLAIGDCTRYSHELLSCEMTIAPDAHAGKYPLTVTDTSGGTFTLQGAFEVVENGAPKIAISAPSSGDTLKGTVTIAATATDDSMVSKVDFYIDGEKAGECRLFPFRYSWNTRSAKKGEHEIEARATDDLGLETRSAKIKVQVSNEGKPGDCDGNGTVSIGEVQKAINMFLGAATPDCGVDCNGDGQVSIGEVQKVINAFLGLPASCQLVL